MEPRGSPLQERVTANAAVRDLRLPGGVKMPDDRTLCVAQVLPVLLRTNAMRVKQGCHAFTLISHGSSTPSSPTVVALWRRLRARLDNNGRHWLDWFCDESLKPRELAAVLGALVR